MLRRLPAWVFLAALVLFASRPAGAEPRLYLTWHAPHGSPGATDTLTLECGSMTRIDTLFMSFDAGVSTGSFTGFMSVVSVQPMFASDTLSSLWESPTGTGLPIWMRFASGPDSASNSPFLASGAGAAACRRTPEGGREIRMVQAVAFDDSATVEAGKIYTVARFILRQPMRSPGCLQPVCIEWKSAMLSTFGGKHLRVEPHGVGVTLNAPPGKRCFDPEPVASPAPAKGGTKQR